MLPQNLRILDNANDALRMIGFGTVIHATNGTYAYDAAKIVPTLLAGFQFVTEKKGLCQDHHVLLIGVNSDVSMAGIMDAKNAGAAERAALEDQNTRAMKVAGPLALQHPERPVLVVFYDESTPVELYNTLYRGGADLMSLHKWGYGTTPNAPKIEGEDAFAKTFAFPMPNDEKPVCYDITPVEYQKYVQVHKLTEAVEGKGPYISAAGKVLFPVNDPSLEKHTQGESDRGGTPPLSPFTPGQP